ncbi:hypothetical protein CC78DRAFT_533085 [Lojkania enalia]|uniref:Uncharacterized protein n=1 Tax=Lojkania enalia TaxID=147567 RepID=A0A9P4KDI5_9PLEO|nr:hypothetical protein CC78DRAFT_533085 [Didymosphaeria enalia]
MMRILTFLLTLISTILAHQQIEQRQATTTPPPSPFSGNAAQLISLYIPSSVESLLYSVYTSVESTTGDPDSVIESAFTAVSHPTWLNAVPSEYQSNIDALESAIDSLRVAATGGVGATTSAAGSEQMASSEASGASTSDSSVSTSGSSSELTTASPSGAPTTTEVVPGGQPAFTSFDWGDATLSSSGFAKPTQAPVAAVGVLGFFGAMLAL